MEKRRRKSKAQRKEDSIRIRVTSQQKRALEAAAQRAGLDVSSWLRALGLREAGRVEIEKAGDNG
ncbi:MAG: plasmid mobilization protein [Terriglobia bacterium]